MLPTNITLFTGGYRKSGGGGGVTTELYYISGDRALIQSQSKKCPQKHGGFWPKIRHFDVIIIAIFMVQTTDNQNCSEK